MHFTGAKVALFLGSDLLVIQRDDNKEIPFPGHFDFPGGGREGAETPLQCVTRETIEEVGLHLTAKDFVWSRQYGENWFFAALRPPSDVNLIRFGDEGQGWSLMSPELYLENTLAVPNFAIRLRHYMAATGLL
ncbi:NUDIX domain-containing protein [Ruegeria sp. Ofav3-42]|uniref:NUDIX domain-containing protein n=1 Tax=Ruegeria sp. Ofav3-42 TaxID=2917759 RepID=UPI001EF57F20|nr:NUDIX hydrolase [Ruegeria sp. Ofav3-42]MCG7522493.1 NUDIX hydrolase [Ruegeria sp. Ofav3-42]